MKTEKKQMQARDTGMALVLILILVGYFTRNDALGLIAAGVQVIVMVWPMFFKPLSIVWFGLSHVLGNVVSKVLLTLLFIILVTPVGLIRRIMGKDEMQRKHFKSKKNSVFLFREYQFVKEDLEKPF